MNAKNFVLGRPAVAENDEVEVVERGRGGIVVVPRSREGVVERGGGGRD